MFKKILKYDKLKILGFLLLFIVILNFIINYYYYNLPEVILWFCDFTSLIVGFSLIFKNKKLLSSLSFIILPAQFLWILYSILFFFGINFNRISIFENSSFNVFIISSIMHILLYPITLYGVYKLGFVKKSWIYSIILGLFILISSYYISYPEDNINCVFYPCDLNFSNNFQQIISNHNYFTLTYLGEQIIFWFIIGFFSYFIHLYLFKYFRFKIE